MNDKHSNTTVSRTDRRGFIKGAAAAGLLGLAPTVASAVAPQATVEDPQKPAGLGSMGLPDGRFPMMYETSVPEAVRVLTQYFKALSQRDLRALSQTVQYPFASYEGTDPGAAMNMPPTRLRWRACAGRSIICRSMARL